MRFSFAIFVLAWLSCLQELHSFRSPPRFQTYQSQCYKKSATLLQGDLKHRLRGQLFARGFGWTKSYSWIEDDYDLEVRIPVPRDTPGKAIHMELHKQAIKMTMDSEDGKKTLLEGKLCGPVALDRCFWLMDRGDDDDQGSTTEACIFLTLEKGIGPDEGVDNTWEGVIKGENVTRTDYSEETFDVDKYVESMGGLDQVEKDSKVDKSMFSLSKLDKDNVLDQLRDEPSKIQDLYERFEQKDKYRNKKIPDDEVAPGIIEEDL